MNHYIEIMDVLCIMNYYIKIMDVLCIINHYIKIMDVLCIINHYSNLLDWHLCGKTFFLESTFFGVHYLLDWHLRGKTFLGKSTFFGVHYHYINILITVKFMKRIILTSLSLSSVLIV